MTRTGAMEFCQKWNTPKKPSACPKSGRKGKMSGRFFISIGAKSYVKNGKVKNRDY
jgi:hypothetical protein